MTLELTALYHLHRFQIILNAKDRDGEFQFPEAFLYAVANGVYPQFHQTWCAGNDPYLDCYNVEKQFMLDAIKYVDDLWTNSKPTPTFYELEDKFGKEYRSNLIGIFRYCFLAKRFDKAVYDTLLKPTEHPTEASFLCRDFDDSDLMLI
jgi:hypothetical protein